MFKWMGTILLALTNKWCIREPTAHPQVTQFAGRGIRGFVPLILIYIHENNLYDKTMLSEKLLSDTYDYSKEQIKTLKGDISKDWFITRADGALRNLHGTINDEWVKCGITAPDNPDEWYKTESLSGKNTKRTQLDVHVPPLIDGRVKKLEQDIYDFGLLAKKYKIRTWWYRWFWNKFWNWMEPEYTRKPYMKDWSFPWKGIGWFISIVAGIISIVAGIIVIAT